MKHPSTTFLLTGALAMAMGCGQQGERPAADVTPAAAPAADARPARPAGFAITLNDADLVSRLQAAPDQDLLQFHAQLRNADLPADYAPPAWLADAPDGFTARQRISEHFAALHKRMSDEGRMAVMRNDPAQVRAMILAGKWASSLDTD